MTFSLKLLIKSFEFFGRLNNFVFFNIFVQGAGEKGRARTGETEQALVLARLGRQGWSRIVGRAPELRDTMIPWPVRASLPALWRGEKVAAVPHLDYVDETVDQPGFGLRLRGFCPAHSLA